jgi:hypothetical protein
MPGLTGAEPGGHPIEAYSTEGIGNGTFAVLLFAVEGLEVFTGNDVMVAAFATPGFDSVRSFMAKESFGSACANTWTIGLTPRKPRQRHQR